MAENAPALIKFSANSSKKYFNFVPKVRESCIASVCDADIYYLKIVEGFCFRVAGDARVSQHGRFGVELRREDAVPLS